MTFQRATHLETRDSAFSSAGFPLGFQKKWLDPFCEGKQPAYLMICGSLIFSTLALGGRDRELEAQPAKAQVILAAGTTAWAVPRWPAWARNAGDRKRHRKKAVFRCW